MKKFALLKIATLVGLATVTSSASAEGFYLRGNLGASIAPNDVSFDNVKIDADNGIVYDFALGYQISPNFAIESDLRYRSLDADKTWTADGGDLTLDAEVNTTSYMLNSIYEFDVETIKPYVKAGLGFASVTTKGEVRANAGAQSVTAKYPKDTDTNLAWAIGTGFNVQLNKSWQFNLDCQFLSAGDVSIRNAKDSSKIKFDAQSHEISAGIRYDF